jgi:hypothetical protein
MRVNVQVINNIGFREFLELYPEVGEDQRLDRTGKTASCSTLAWPIAYEYVYDRPTFKCRLALSESGRCPDVPKGKSSDRAGCAEQGLAG